MDGLRKKLLKILYFQVYEKIRDHILSSFFLAAKS